MVCSRREHEISTLMYTHVLDFILSNAYAFYLFCMEITKFIGPNTVTLIFGYPFLNLLHKIMQRNEIHYRYLKVRK